MKKLQLADDLLLLLTDDDLHWAAGLFEGEGTVTIAVRNSDTTYRLIAIVGNTDRQIITFFHERWGGWFQPMYGERPGRKPGWTWTVAGPRAETFVRDILPFVRTDRVRKKLALALDFRVVQSAPGKERGELYKTRQREIYLAMKTLNRRGVASETEHGE